LKNSSADKVYSGLSIILIFRMHGIY